ncbi:DUF2939 domain-containing protein [Diaphorobacter ruginosibacter]|uniref:DUF2939 domain-containing protein n=1 Tax=Diaphorobacter ruginosibacter TaxID=1715720 RepID=A0A7G9RNB2_9BURK|nr:DUF2939 domain-containing protein [Diaphorobacter ruginosibacter]QNN57087.1 DUF2939 domain-containing protein [Diaphorobacter ruginosibacter]
MKNRKSVVFPVLVAAALGFATLLYVSPYLAMQSIKKAIDAGDSAALSEFVDFPVLRENMKGRLMRSLASKLPKAEPGSDNPLANIGQAIGGLVVGTAVDQLVTPAGIMMMMETGRVARGPAPAADPAAGSSRGGEAEAGDADQRKGFSLHYQGFGKVRAFRQRDPGTAFIFRRDGLLGWKLVNMELEGL